MAARLSQLSRIDASSPEGGVMSESWGTTGYFFVRQANCSPCRATSTLDSGSGITILPSDCTPFSDNHNCKSFRREN